MNARPDSATDRPETAARLDVERTRALDRLANLHLDFAAMVAASADSNADDEHDPEGATIAFERSQLDALILQAQRHLADIGLARDRLEQGTYEKCESCGNPIGQARLEARPVARDCIACATLKTPVAL